MAGPQKRDEIKARCNQLAEKYGSPATPGLGLELLALRLLALDPDFADVLRETDSDLDMAIQQFHSGGKDDGGIDGLLYDIETTRVVVVQSKQKSGPVESKSLSEARDFFSRVNEWAEASRVETLNANAQRLLEESGFNPRMQEIELVFVTTQTARDSDDHAKLAEDFTMRYQEQGLRVTCSFWVQADLTERISQADAVHFSQPVPPIQLTLPKGEWFVFKDGPMEVIVASVKGNYIADMHNRRDVKSRLFNANVRAALSNGRINPKIKETARSKEEGGNFFYYNNGITATCSSWQIDGDSVLLRDLQVVNGAQTVSSLATALRGNSQNPDVYVLLRIICTGEAYRNKNRVAEQITRFQNTQNPVRVSDFYSNEPLQSWIASAFDQQSGKQGFPSVWYEHKRGLKPAKSTSGRKKLTLEELAYLRYACLHGAPFTYKSAKEIWSGANGDEAYWRAFGLDDQPCESWPQEEIARAGWMISSWWELRAQAGKLRKQYQERAKGKEGHERDELAATFREATFLSVLARYVVALAHTGVVHEIETGRLTSFADIVAAPAASKALVDSIIGFSRRLVREQYERELGRGANPRLNMSQSDATWTHLTRMLKQELVAQV